MLTDNLLHMLCLVFAFRYLMQLQNEYSVTVCYFSVLDVEKLWLWMCLWQVSILCHFPWF